ncbi:MAG: HAMP domain-containing sensor histidine kinase [Ilumatobacteraceae bacterium]
MSLRAKLALVLASLAALAAVGVGWSSYTATTSRMLSEIDSTLRSSKDRIDGATPPAGSNDGNGNPFRGPGFAGPNGPTGIEQTVTQQLDANGVRVDSSDESDRYADIELPVSHAAREIAETRNGEHIETVTGSDGHEYRLYTRSSRRVGTIQIGRDLSEMNRVLSDLRARILMVGAIAVVVAACAGWLFARGLTKSLRALTAAASEVSSTGRLDIDVDEKGKDEVGRLGAAFAGMLGALNRSREEQQRLVQDAGHELRTPLTSLRTNVDVLRRHHDMPDEMRTKVLDDLDVEVGELSSLVEEVVAVGSGRTSDEPVRRFALADAVSAASERVGRRTGRMIEVHTDASVVVAQRTLIERAITNLLDNAAKFDGTAEPIVITAEHGRVSVRDHGSGIAPDDLGHVFDRFYRAVAARSQPGSGLGLSIVTEIAAAHAGSTFADNDPTGGAIVGFQIPVAD